MKKPCARRDGINMSFRCRGGYSVGGFYFQISIFSKKMPELPENACPLLESLLPSCPGETSAVSVSVPHVRTFHFTIFTPNF
jgi:hypothetical protein